MEQDGRQQCQKQAALEAVSSIISSSSNLHVVAYVEVFCTLAVQVASKGSLPGCCLAAQAGLERLRLQAQSS